MNKRQRKKHHIAEFQQLGFELHFCTPAAWSDEEQRAFSNECIGQVETLGLSIGGSADTCWDVFVAGLRDHDSVTPAQRQALLDWLAAHPDVSEVHAGELQDAWYSPAGAETATD